MKKTVEDYKKAYLKIKESESIEKLSNWTLKNNDEKFDADKYRSNLDSFLDDIVESVDKIQRDTKWIE